MEKFKYVYTQNYTGDAMPNITLTVPKEMYREMKVHAELKWSDVVRQAIRKKLAEIKWMDQVLSESELTESDAEIIGHKIKAEIIKRFK
jgi:Arc/MetJ-type ribon-helix-helix transcriptional regulator